MFDNGNKCEGPRADLAPFTRIVEYDISSGTQAVFSREYRRAGGYHTLFMGGVMELPNGNWLIAWGNEPNVETAAAVSISEVDPETGTEHFELLMHRSGKYRNTYRVYRHPEADLPIPLNLP